MDTIGTGFYGSDAPSFSQTSLSGHSCRTNVWPYAFVFHPNYWRKCIAPFMLAS